MTQGVLPSSARRRLGFAGLVLSLALVLATVLAAFARVSWLADIAVQFRVQFVAGAFLAGALLLLGGRRRWLVVVAAVAALNGWFIADSSRSGDSMAFAWGARPAQAASDARRTSAASGVAIRVAAVNVLYLNDQYPRVLDWIRRAAPDVLAVPEASARWVEQLGTLAVDYPYRRLSASNGRFQTALLSRWPLEDGLAPAFARADNRYVEAVAVIRGERVRVVGVHAVWPLTPAHARLRNAEFAAIAQAAATIREPLILIGDFNSTALSPHFQQLLRGVAGLRSAAAGFGWQPTWPAAWFPVGIQIDHVLVSPSFKVVSFGRGPLVGSDHLPIFADLALPSHLLASRLTQRQ